MYCLVLLHFTCQYWYRIVNSCTGLSTVVLGCQQLYRVVNIGLGLAIVVPDWQ